MAQSITLEAGVVYPGKRIRKFVQQRKVLDLTAYLGRCFIFPAGSEAKMSVGLSTMLAPGILGTERRYAIYKYE